MLNLLDLTLATPAENLALDEALWEACESGGPETLRFWESPVHFVVLGYANRAAAEVNLEACEARQVPVLRRITGGGAVLQGPGCLNYTLVRRIASSGPTASIRATNLDILNRHAAALHQVLGLAARRCGDTDLAIGAQKFSGNSQRRGRHALLFHGTFLLHLDFEIVQATLLPPTRQPDYRRGRSHDAFLMNLETDAASIKRTICRAWDVAPLAEPMTRHAGPSPVPTGESGQAPNGAGALEWTEPDGARKRRSLIERARELATEKYNTSGWNHRF